MKRLLLSLSLALTASAQIAVYTLDNSGVVETAVDGLADLGTAQAGDTLDTRFRLRNTGTANVTLSSLRVSGVGFSVQNDPSKPYLMAPGTNVDFRIRFQPSAYGSYSASLIVNDKTYFLRAIAPAGVTLRAEDGTALQSTSLVSFGRVDFGETATRRFTLRNETTATLTVRSIAVSAAPFQGPSGITLPVELAAGTSASFEVRFAPTRAGVFTATLAIDGRSIPLEGVALDPPFPQAQIVVDSTASQSGSQAKLQIKLSAASQVTGTGTLTLALKPTVSGVEDAAVMFLANGTRTVTVSVTKGEDVARVNSSADILFQTGTTAGEITLQLKLGFQDVRLPVTLASMPVRVDASRAQRTATGVEMSLEAFDNTRTATHVTFTFYDRAGKTIGSPMRINLTESFASWWRQSGLGGAFIFRAAFPVAGDASQLAAADVEFENSLGKTPAARVTF